MLGNFSLVLSSDFFAKSSFSKNSVRNTISVKQFGPRSGSFLDLFLFFLSSLHPSQKKFSNDRPIDFLSFGQEVSFQIISNLYYREVDIKIYNPPPPPPPPKRLLSVFLLSNIPFGCVKERSQGDVSFKHPKHLLL